MTAGLAIVPIQGLPEIELSRTAFFFDIDGTLLDIALTPDSVQVPSELVRNLQRLSQLCGGAMALLSGRTVADIDRLFDPVRFSASGGHGAEFRPIADGPYEPSFAHIPSALKKSFEALATISGVILEDKAYALALHYRLTPDPEPVLHGVAALETEAAAAGYVILPGKSVFELKPSGCDKGRALRHFMTLPHFIGRVPIFAGDDTTDNDAFAVLAEYGGTGISIGGPAPAARHMVSSPAVMREWIGFVCGSP